MLNVGILKDTAGYCKHFVKGFLRSIFIHFYVIIQILSILIVPLIPWRQYRSIGLNRGGGRRMGLSPHPE